VAVESRVAVVAPGPGHKEAEVPGSIQVKAKANSRPWDRVRINRPAAGDKALLVAARPEVAEEVAVARVVNVNNRRKAEPADKFNHRVRGRLLLGRGAEPVAALVEKVVTNKPVNRGKGRDRLLKARQLVVAGERAVLAAAVAKENAKVSSRQASKAKAADKPVFNSSNRRRRSNSNRCGRSSSNKQGHSSNNSNNFADSSRAKVAAAVAVAEVVDDARKVHLHRHRVNDTRQPEGRASSTAFPGRRASPRLIGGILGRVKVVRRGPFFSAGRRASVVRHNCVLENPYISMGARNAQAGLLAAGLDQAWRRYSRRQQGLTHTAF
jgi:hypothetical protein